MEISFCKVGKELDVFKTVNWDYIPNIGTGVMLERTLYTVTSVVIHEEMPDRLFVYLSETASV